MPLNWYQDLQTLRLVDGPNREPYDRTLLFRMYSYLERHGELYYIEIKKGNVYIPIGDVTLESDDFPIVIGDSSFRGKGIGYQVVQALINSAKTQGMKKLYVQDIYDYNSGSIKLFEKCGFIKDKKTKLGHSYRLTLHST
ncbi:GNAT family N-acetyltransferase [Sporolactobacillus laevolacticus]|uniref:GNAT family N-acetyltransferase n=1 Tax=Sporolactobacillus laevolacticus TaxID=33018 RepID=UPI0025B3689D|nr:GNAT family N-acetyltransferase [Sporolactobacillus laevolacticus]MDN3956033.1 GNAT family N-acetyltransferase [Sporolactobacillus laevolacticus]